ncbi:MAG: class I SAM-dependent methyltransferase [Proteobacteria bacterium]|nr:class I SAM-dependent methyltransferase [Pseudomonadota bacterium]
MASSAHQAGAANPGLVLRRPHRYDFTVWLFTRGGERGFREKILDLAKLKPGERVLDVGCGTGTLAIAASKRVGAEVHGLDASVEMLARAESKARRDRAKVAFTEGAAQTLPYADGQFDVVLATLMLHHLPRKDRELCAREMRRVLAPGGRLLVVDFAIAAQGQKGVLAHFHRHGHVKPEALTELLSNAGFSIAESGPVGVSDLHFVLATPS